MSMSVLGPYGQDGGGSFSTEVGATSPFAPVGLLAGGAPTVAPPPGQVLHSPFAEAPVAVGDGGLVAEYADALLAELDDAEFAEALEALTDEAAARHLRSVGTWSSDSEAPALATADTTQWMEQLAGEADRMLGALEVYFADRPADSLQEGEIEAAAGLDDFTNPADVQQLFLGKLLKKAKKVASGVGKLAKKGLAVVGKLALGPLFGILRRLVKPLLHKVLGSAIGKLPESVQSLATTLAAKLGGNVAAEFDHSVAEIVAAPNNAVAAQLLAELDMPDGTASGEHELDAARARLVRELSEADPGEAPTAQLEQFIPVVMAALPLIRTGVKMLGRDRIVRRLAGPLSGLIKGMVGADAAKMLSRHIASTGMGMLGLEADPSSLGGEALVAATEDTVRHVTTLPPESLEHELLLESEVQDAFAEAVARHMPAALLRPELVEQELEGERGLWVMMPRATRPCFRYKKYSRVIPVRVTRPVARAVVLPNGETLERRLLDTGAEVWPVDGEVELFELLPGGDLGHVAAFESGDEPASAGLEFEELTEGAAALLAGNPQLARTGRHGQPGQRRHPGSRYFRFRFRGRPLRRRHVFALRFDLTAPQPVLRVNLPLGERDTHELVAHLQGKRLVQVVSVVRRALDKAVLEAMTRRLEHLLAKHKIEAPSGAAARLAERLVDAMLRAVSQQLPAAAAALTQAARDPQPGATLTFAFGFADRAAVVAGTPASDPTVTFRAGQHRD